MSDRTVCDEWADDFRAKLKEKERAKDARIADLERERDDLKAQLAEQVDERDRILADWNEIVRVSGSKTHGGAIGHVANLVAQLAERTRERDAAIARAEAAEKDAGRYRWIRDCWYIAGEEWPEELQHEPTRPAQFDAAIDAASGDSNA